MDQRTEAKYQNGAEGVDQTLLLLPHRSKTKKRAIRQRRVVGLFRSLSRRLPLWRVCLNTSLVERYQEGDSGRSDSVYVRSALARLAKLKTNKVL